MERRAELRRRRPRPPAAGGAPPLWRDVRAIVAVALLATAIVIWRLVATEPAPPVRALALRYRPLTAARVVTFYEAKGSQLATPQTAAAILAAARRHDLDPAVLVAVTGQEQAFVPVGDNPRIAANPFNVEGCWCTTHLSIAQSAEIAADTIAHRLRCLPSAGANLIVWINSPANPCVKSEGRYASDPHWGPGVATLYRTVAPALGLDRRWAVFHS